MLGMTVGGKDYSKKDGNIKNARGRHACDRKFRGRILMRQNALLRLFVAIDAEWLATQF